MISVQGNSLDQARDELGDFMQKLSEGGSVREECLGVLLCMGMTVRINDMVYEYGKEPYAYVEPVYDDEDDCEDEDEYY